MDESPITLTDIHVDEAIAIAIQLQRHGRLADAEGVYRKVLAVAPDHADALHFAGVVAHQQGRSEAAAALIARSLALLPDQADWHSNHGIVLKALGRIEEAVAAYERAIALDPDHARAHNNLGVLLKVQGRLGEAEAAYRRAIALHPRYIDAYHNLGIVLAAQGRLRDAVLCYCKVTTLSPGHREARRLQAMAHCTLGEVDKATVLFEEWLAEEPGNEIAQHMLAACSGKGVPPRASDAYVERTFDAFAESFDEKLARLSYQAPQIVSALLQDAGLAPVGALDVLDAGCGTGLCGPLVAPYARRLTGVDLSGGMLARARERAVYDDLVQAELTGYLGAHPGAFDLVISADTLVYFGALDEVVAAAAAALRPGGVLICTLESMHGTAEDDYRLCTHGRYSHAHAYVARLFAHAGFDAVIAPVSLRMEAGEPVHGLAVRAVRGRAGAEAVRTAPAAVGERDA